jgi:hypothetical protein
MQSDPFQISFLYTIYNSRVGTPPDIAENSNDIVKLDASLRRSKIREAVSSAGDRVALLCAPDYM